MKIIFFDIDGTLIHAQQAGRRAMLGMLSDLTGRDIGLNGVSFGGMTDLTNIRNTLRANAFSDAEVNRLLPLAVDALPVYMKRETEATPGYALPGILPLLSHLRARADVAIGLITGNLRTTAPYKLSNAGVDPVWFPFGGYGDDGESRNELPPIALRRAENVLNRQLSPAQAIVIGDTTADVECANVNGMRSVAVLTGWTSRETLAAAQPDLLLDDLSDLDHVLAQMGLDMNGGEPE